MSKYYTVSATLTETQHLRFEVTATDADAAVAAVHEHVDNYGADEAIFPPGLRAVTRVRVTDITTDDFEITDTLEETP